MSLSLILSLMHGFAAVNGAILALLALVSGQAGTQRAKVTFGGFLIVTSGLLGLFVLLDNGFVTYSRGLGIIMDAAGVAVSCLFLDYVLTTLGFPGRRLWVYAPLGIQAVSALVFGDWLGVGSDFAGLLFIQSCMTAVGFGFYIQRRRTGQLPRKPAAIRILPFLFAGMIILHVTQFARMVFPGVPFLFDLVPLAGTVIIGLFSIFALAESRLIVDMTRSSARGHSDPGLAGLMTARLEETRAFLDPDMSLDRAAELCGVSARALSDHLNGAHEISFREYLNRLRVGEACRMLRSPDEERTSVEAIGLLSGYRSRSAFYDAFKSVTGQTPNAYRSA